MKKSISSCLFALFLVLIFTSCSGNAAQVSASPPMLQLPTTTAAPTPIVTPSSSPAATASFTPSTSPNSETKKLLLAEDNTTQAIFHIGMMREEVIQALSENKLRLNPNGYSDEHTIMHTGKCETVDGITILFGDVGKHTDLLDEIVIHPVSKTELYSPYATQKGLKIGDDVETVLKLYGEPLNTIKSNSSLTPFMLAYYYELPINKGSGVIHLQMQIYVSQAEDVNFNKVDAISYYW